MRASRRLPLLVLVAVLGLLGPPAGASASDLGLREVVQRDVALDKRLTAAAKRLRGPSTKTFPAYVRFLRRATNYYARLERASDGLQRSYRRQAPQTADARRGRTLVLRGHRDVSNGAHESAVALRRGIRQMTGARSESAYRRAGRRMVRVLNAQDRRFRRGSRSVGRGWVLIRNAPTPPAPAPAPGAPAPAPPAPTPTPSSPTPSAPGSLIPGLPLLPGLGL